MFQIFRLLASFNGSEVLYWKIQWKVLLHQI